MNWLSVVAVSLTATSMLSALLYWALRQFIRAELAELRRHVLDDLATVYLRKDVAMAQHEAMNDRVERLELRRV